MRGNKGTVIEKSEGKFGKGEWGNRGKIRGDVLERVRENDGKVIGESEGTCGKSK